MEVAGQWRQEWAGTAEYGKVTEGGVTRRVARAMEVLQASGPGARVRVMRAAYHSTSAPGVPASSYMLHSSRRVISSGFNILESPTYPTKPLEISSTPFESSPESNIETENYKVTEPDDTDISEPSKWRGTTGRGSIRMPSEESSSTDNASIVDLDSKFNRKGLYRKYSYDSENSDIHSLKRDSARTSPHLDVPVTLNTLKYKSLLNSSNDWNNRRKSYSFEDTSPLNEVMIQSNDTLAMESSTDSGICKSSEVVNDFTEDIRNKDFMSRPKPYNIQDSIDNWQRRSKLHSSYKSTKMKSYNDHDTVAEDPRESSIAVQSAGKLTITVPITIEGADDEHKTTNDDGDRKLKKVGFCKTELHFAAESGRVNIIATDEKPPPTNDFRKRRSAFVPIKDKFEKPITLFGEKGEFPVMDEYKLRDFSESAEFDENTAATKSILKNKIPKPKPYLLGENMAFGNIHDPIQSLDSPVSNGVSLINKELQTSSISSNKRNLFSPINETIKEKSFTSSVGTTTTGPSQTASSNTGKPNFDKEGYPLHVDPTLNTERKKLHVLQMSPVPKPKTRQLRESDLTYFGIANHHDSNIDNKTKSCSKSALPWNDLSQNTFESVRLVKKYSNSAQNSDAESTDSHEYQNIKFKTNFTPVPTPRSRTKYVMKPEVQGVFLKPITEQVNDTNISQQEPRRSRTRKQDELLAFTSRSLSAPAKNHTRSAVETRYQYEDTRTSYKKENAKQRKEEYAETKQGNKKIHKDVADDPPLYANVEGIKHELNELNNRVKADKLSSQNNKHSKETRTSINKSSSSRPDSLEKTPISNKSNHRVRRTEKLCTPEKSNTLNKNKTKKISNENLNYSGSVRDNAFKRRQKPCKDNDILMCNEGNKTEVNEVKTVLSRKEETINKVNSHTLQDKNKETELSYANKKIAPRSSEYRTHSKHPYVEIDGTDKVKNNTNMNRSSRKSEYVIKYDDKNGTVSSICKVRSGHSAQRKKHTSKERSKEYLNDTKSKNKEKSGLRNAAPCPSNN